MQLNTGELILQQQREGAGERETERFRKRKGGERKSEGESSRQKWGVKGKEQNLTGDKEKKKKRLTGRQITEGCGDKERRKRRKTEQRKRQVRV